MFIVPLLGVFWMFFGVSRLLKAVPAPLQAAKFRRSNSHLESTFKRHLTPGQSPIRMEEGRQQAFEGDRGAKRRDVEMQDGARPQIWMSLL